MLYLIKDKKTLKFCIITFFLLVISIVFFSLYYNRSSSQLAEVNEFNNISNFNISNIAKSVIDKDKIKVDDEGIIDFKSLNSNIEESKVNTVIINSPIIELEKNNNNDTDIDNTLYEMDDLKDDDDENNKFLRFEKNQDMLAKMESTILACVPLEWFASGSKITIDSSSSSKIDDYILYEKLDQEYFKNKKSGNIKIYSLDEIWQKDNNEYVLQTRCYIN